MLWTHFRICTQSRSVLLPGVEPYTDLALLLRRFLSLGFSTVQALTMRWRNLYRYSEESEYVLELKSGQFGQHVLNLISKLVTYPLSTLLIHIISDLECTKL